MKKIKKLLAASLFILPVFSSAWAHPMVELTMAGYSSTAEWDQMHVYVYGYKKLYSDQLTFLCGMSNQTYTKGQGEVSVQGCYTTQNIIPSRYFIDIEVTKNGVRLGGWSYGHIVDNTNDKPLCKIKITFPHALTGPGSNPIITGCHA